MTTIVHIERYRRMGKTLQQRNFVDAVLRRAHLLSLSAPNPPKCVNASVAQTAAVVSLVRTTPAPSLTGQTTAATSFNGGDNAAT